MPELTAYGLDVTLQCRMPADECRRRFRGGPFEVVRDMAEVWFRGRDRITFHDPLAAACIFEPDICTYEPGRVRMNLDTGETLLEVAEDSPHRVAATVNPERFFERYFEVTSPFARS